MDAQLEKDLEAIRTRFDQNIILVFFGLVTLSILFSSIFLTSESSRYEPKRVNEMSVGALVTSVNYGYNEDSLQKKRALDPQGESCFIKVANFKELFRYPSLGCNVQSGDKISVLVSDDTKRLDPSLFSLQALSLKWLSTAAFWAFVLLAVSLTIGVFISRFKSKTSIGVAQANETNIKE